MKNIQKTHLVLVLGSVFVIGLIVFEVIWPINHHSEVSGVDNSSAEVTTLTGEAVLDVPLVLPTDYRELPTEEAVVTTVVDQSDAPWAFVWLPDGDMLVTERFGSLQRVRDGVTTEIEGVPDVLSAGQGGLLDVTTHPDFTDNQYVYLSYAYGTSEANRLRIARGVLNEDVLKDVEVLFEVAETKAGAQHFGSRFAWLPDGTLVFSVGDGGNPPTEYSGALIREQAQNLQTYFGKILRINDDGSIPNDNPFVGRPDVHPEIYSYGHRNVQGIAYDPIHNRVVASEHGSKGGDEFNEIVPGGNYGWPLTTFATEYDVLGTEIAPNQTLPGVVNPRAVWTPTVAPSAAVVNVGERYGASGDIFMAAMLLRSNTTIAAYATRPAGAIIHLLTGDAGEVAGQKLVRLGDVRVRSIAFGSDGYLYALTDTTTAQNRPGLRMGSIVRLEAR